MRYSMIIGIITLLLIAGIPNANALDSSLDRSEFIFRDELVPGMEGYALTVIDGIRIDRIDVRLKGIIKDRCFNGRDMLLIETSGDVVEYSHGIAGGMSGSPIYFDERLAGAVSGHWLHTDQLVGIGTPIEYMLENLDYEDAYDDSYADPLPCGNPFFNEQENGSGSSIIGIARDESEAIRLQAEMGSDALIFVKALTPIIVGGVEPRVLEMMRDDIESTFNGEVWDIPVTLPGNIEIPDRMEPGSALGTMWSRGDIQYGSYGTVTYVTPDGRVLGFGHSMSRRGRTEVPMAYGYIYGRRPGINKSNKYGGPTRLCGVITQDRGGAISGYFGIEPRMIPVGVKTSVNGGEGREYRSEVTGSRFYYPVVCSAVAKACVWRVIPQFKGGVLDVAWRIEFEDGEVISRRDIYSGIDPVTSFGNDLERVNNWAVENRFKRLVPKSVTVEADFNPIDDHVRIIDAELVDAEAGLKFIPQEREAVLVDEDGIELAHVRHISGELEIELEKEDGRYVFEPGDPIFIHVTAKARRGDVSHYLFRLLIPAVEPGEKGAIQIRGGTDMLPGPEVIGPEAYDEALDKRGKIIHFPTFADSVQTYIAEVDDGYSAGELVVELIFNSIEDAETFDDASGLYSAKTMEFDAPVVGYVRIPFKIPEEEEEEESD